MAVAAAAQGAKLTKEDERLVAIFCNIREACLYGGTGVRIIPRQKDSSPVFIQQGKCEQGPVLPGCRLITVAALSGDKGSRTSSQREATKEARVKRPVAAEKDL
jgi:hypothetical protein